MKRYEGRVVYAGTYSLAEYNFLFLNICYLLENQFHIETRREFYYDVDIEEEIDWLEMKKDQWYITASFHDFEFVVGKTMKYLNFEVDWDANTGLVEMVQKLSENSSKKFNYFYEKETESIFFNNKRIECLLSLEVISLLLMLECWGSDNGDFYIYFNNNEIAFNTTTSVKSGKNIKYKLTLENNLYLNEVFEEKVFFLYHGYKKWGTRFIKSLSSVEMSIKEKSDDISRVRDIKKEWLELSEDKSSLIEMKDKKLLKWVSKYSPHKMDETMLTVIPELE